MFSYRHRLILFVLALATFGVPKLARAVPPDAENFDAKDENGDSLELTGRRKIRRDAKVLMPTLQTDLARRFLKATEELPPIVPRTIYRSDKGKFYSKYDRALLTDEQKASLKAIPIDEETYYNTKYGSPLAYVRAMELLASHGMTDLNGSRVMDFGYGGVGHLRLMANLGADVVGVDVDPFLDALYSRPEDREPVIRSPNGRASTVTLVSGRFPTDAEVVRKVGAKYDLIISKNTLKNGYVHPSRPVDKRMTMNLGVDDDAFVRTLYSLLKPGGMVMIYNICPAPSLPDQPYKPWSDGRCPFPPAMWRAAGFEVLEFDVDETAPVQKMGHLLRWDKGEGKMDLKNDLFASYSLFQRPVGPPSVVAAER